MRSYHKMALASAALLMVAQQERQLDEADEIDVTAIEGNNSKAARSHRPVTQRVDEASKNMPHQGKRERERRLRQMAKQSRKSEDQ
jgi:hypothetical protein